MDRLHGLFITVVAMLGLPLLFLSFFFFEGMLKKEYIERERLEYISVPDRDQRMYQHLLRMCKAKYPREYVTEYMECTATQMRRYLEGKDNE